VHVDLNRHQEVLPIFRIGIRSIAARSRLAGRAADANPRRASAVASAPASVALVVTSPSATPRWTIVWAIWGRMPLMMQSAPISRAADTVLREVLCDQGIDRRDPVMSMTRSAPVSTIRWRRLSITTWVRALSSVPISGSASTPSHNCTRASRAPAAPLPLPADHFLAGFLVHLRRVEPQAVEEQRGRLISATKASGSLTS
jgi:hypothetical protein